MAPLLGMELTHSLFLERFTSLCGDSLCQIRKICAANFGEFTTVCGIDTSEQHLVSNTVSILEKAEKCSATNETHVSR